MYLDGVAEAGDEPPSSARWGKRPLHSCFQAERYGGICNAPLHRIVGADPVSARISNKLKLCTLHSSLCTFNFRRRRGPPTPRIVGADPVSARQGLN